MHDWPVWGWYGYFELLAFELVVPRHFFWVTPGFCMWFQKVSWFLLLWLLLVLSTWEWLRGRVKDKAQRCFRTTVIWWNLNKIQALEAALMEERNWVSLTLEQFVTILDLGKKLCVWGVWWVWGKAKAKTACSDHWGTAGASLSWGHGKLLILKDELWDFFTLLWIGFRFQI